MEQVSITSFYGEVLEEVRRIRPGIEVRALVHSSRKPLAGDHRVARSIGVSARMGRWCELTKGRRPYALAGCY